MTRLFRCIVSLILLCAPLGAAAQGADLSSLMSDLKQGGYVIVFRHGATHRDQSDTDPFNLDNVAKQRQLNDNGRQAAKQIGEAFRKTGVPFGKVYTSRFYRAVETGRLVSGAEVIPSVDITEGGQVVTPMENDRRAEAFRKLVATKPAAGPTTVIVSHKPNI